MQRDQIELQQIMLINQDPPEHTKTRQIISRGFTPRSIGAMHDILVERAETIVADVLAKGEGDFVTEVAAELPLQAIADLLGVPQEDRASSSTGPTRCWRRTTPSTAASRTSPRPRS